MKGATVYRRLKAPLANAVSNFATSASNAVSNFATSASNAASASSLVLYNTEIVSYNVFRYFHCCKVLIVITQIFSTDCVN